MRARTFTWVLLLSAALAGAAWFYLGREAAPPDLQGRLLFPDLRAVLTGARAIEITTADDSFALESTEAGGWAVRERHGYPAQTATVRRFLLGVAGLEIRSRKTSNPDNYARLDLTAPEDDAESAAARVVIRDEDGGELAAFLAGLTRPASEVDNPDPDRGVSALKDLSQIFVRLPDAPTVWLVEGELNIARAPTDYINRERLTDTARDTIRSITVARPADDGDAFTVSRAAQGEDFELENLAEGMRLKNQFQLNDLVDLFVNLKFEDVTVDDEIAWAYGDGDGAGDGDGDGDGNGDGDGDGAGNAGAGLTATMRAFDKSTVVMEQGVDANGELWIRLRAEPAPAPEPADAGDGDAGDGEAGDGGDAGDGEAGDGEAGDGEAGDGEAGDGEAGDGEAGDGEAGDGEASAGDAGATVDTTRIDALNERWSGWAFQLPDFRAETLNRARDELVEPEEAEEGAGGESDGG